QLDYPNGSPDRVGQHTYLTQFLGSDAASLDFHNSGNFKVDTIVMHITGYIYIPEGTHTFTVKSDDGFRLRIGDETVVQYSSNGFHYESDTSYYQEGVYEFDLVWYQNGGNAGLELHSSLPGDISDYLYASLEDTGLPLVDPDGDGTYELSDGEPAGDDTIMGEDGNDSLYGNGGDDSIYGGDEDDLLSGDDGNDLLDGGKGRDWIFGGAGNDLVDFDRFDWFIKGGPGRDTLRGSDDDDDIRFDDSNFDQSEKNAGFEVVELGNGNNLLIGANAGSLDGVGGPLLVTGGDGRDVISLWEIGDDIVDARGGTDTVYGGPGNDVIFGGGDRDFLYPGAGADTVYGGEGNDIYHVGLGDGVNWLVDTADGSENNGLILFHGYNDPEWDDYYGVSPENWSYVVEDVMVDSGSGPQLERVVTMTFDNGEPEDSDAYQEGTARFLAGTIETLNLWDHEDVLGGAPPRGGDFNVSQYQWNETTETFDPTS
ncbi:MAG: PA14 domain-containing protein, partial [Rhodovibrionaceae bacterium]